MAESDAEWIDVDREFGRPQPRDPTRPPGPNRPPPRPRTSTFRPRGIFPTGDEAPGSQIPDGRRPRRPFPGRDYGDPGAERPTKASSSSATTISVSVVSVVCLLALAVLLLYLFVLRKRLKKVKKSQSDSQFCLRVEDVTHLDIDDSAKLYVNTTDLQKLVSSVRIKNKKPPPPLPFNNDFPDVVNVSRPPVPLPSEVKGSSSFVESGSHNSTSSDINVGFTNSTYDQNDSAENIYSNVSPVIKSSEYSDITIARPAPPPPTQGSSKVHANSGENSNSVGITDEDKISKQIVKPPPPVLPKPAVASSHVKTLTKEMKPKVKNEKPVLTQKPKTPPPNLPYKLKPSGAPMKPLLPRLKMNLKPQINRQESEFSTPDTAISYLSDTEKVEPELLSVKDKKAFLEGILAAENAKKKL